MFSTVINYMYYRDDDAIAKWFVFDKNIFIYIYTQYLVEIAR